MKKYTHNITIPGFTSRLARTYLGGHSMAVLDLETTGLSASRNQVILSGIVLPAEKTLLSPEPVPAEAIQFFAEDPSQERDVLLATMDILSDTDIIITYNGRSFDMPFLFRRADQYSIRHDLHAYDLDLFSVVSGYTDLKNVIGSLRQKNLEIFMGLSQQRQDEISGGDSVRMYQNYAAGKDPQLLRKILLHNHDDILQLARLLPVIEKTDFHRAMYSLGFPAPAGTVRRLDLTASDFRIHFTAPSGQMMPDYISFPTESMPCQITASSASGICEVNIPVEHIVRNVAVIDAHRLLGDSVPASLSSMPAYESGYLVMNQAQRLNYTEINAFVMEFLRRLDIFGLQ